MAIKPIKSATRRTQPTRPSFGHFPSPGGQKPNPFLERMPGGGAPAQAPVRATSDRPMYGNIGLDERRMAKGDINQLMKRVGRIRKQRDLGADSASDTIWADRIKAGKATFGDVRQRLDGKAGSAAQTAKSWSATSPANGGPKYPTELPGLSAADFADLAARRRAASSGLEEAMARRAAGSAEIGAAHKSLLDRIKTTYADARGAGMQDLGGRGMAFQPRGAGQMLKKFRNQEASSVADAEADKASRMAALARMVEDARRSRDTEFASIEADEVRRRSDLSRLIGNIGA